MVAAPAVKFTEIGNCYGFRTWIEYGLKQSKDALGWADFRMTHYEQIEKWWEMVMSAFLMVSLFAEPFNDSCPTAHQHFVRHPWWNNQSGWKSLLNKRAFNYPTISLFQLARAMVRGVSYHFIAVWL